MAKNKDNSKIWLIAIICVIVFFAFVYPSIVKKVVNYTIPGPQTPLDLNDPNNNFTEEEFNYYANRLTFEVNYYKNADGSGIELQEIDLDYFTDASLTHQYAKSTGMQYLGDFESYFARTGDVENRVVEDFYYYDTTASDGDVITWNGGNVATNLKRSTPLIVKIDDKPYLLQMTGISYHDNWDFLNLFTRYYDYGDLFADILQAVKTNSKGYGDYSIIVDLSNYFSIWKYDEVSKKFLKETDYAKEVIVESVVNFHFYERGATKASDSLFGQIALDKTYNTVKNTIAFDVNGGIGRVDSITAPQGSTVIVPEPGLYEIEPGSYSSVHRVGYSFVGWNTLADGSGTAYLPGDSFTLNENITLYAQWSEDVYLTYNHNYVGTTDYVIERKNGSSVILSSFSRAGYAFVEWNTLADGSGTAYQSGDQIVMTENITLYAQWARKGLELIFVSSKSLETMQSQMLANGIAEQLNANEFTRNNSIFRGWDMELKNATGESVNIVVNDCALIKITELAVEERPYNGAIFKVEIGAETYYSEGYGANVYWLYLVACWELQDWYVGDYSFDGGSFSLGVNGLESFSCTYNNISITASQFDQREWTVEPDYVALWGRFGNNEYTLVIGFNYDENVYTGTPTHIYLRQGNDVFPVDTYNITKIS